MSKTSDITFQEVVDRLVYEPDTGHVKRTTYGRSDRPVGQTMGTVNSAGYIVVSLLGRPVLAHRIAFMLMNGKWPNSQIDHINRVRVDNRWANLREATLAQNNVNATRSIKRDLPTGVSRTRGSSRFSATISINGRNKHLGSFPTAQAASAAYKAAKLKLHGEFSPF